MEWDPCQAYYYRFVTFVLLFPVFSPQVNIWEIWILTHNFEPSGGFGMVRPLFPIDRSMHCLTCFPICVSKCCSRRVSRNWFANAVVAAVVDAALAASCWCCGRCCCFCCCSCWNLFCCCCWCKFYWCLASSSMKQEPCSFLPSPSPSLHSQDENLHHSPLLIAPITSLHHSAASQYFLGQLSYIYHPPGSHLFPSCMRLCIS